MKKLVITILFICIVLSVYAYDVPANLFDAEKYVKNLPVEPYNSIVSERNIAYARKVESLSPIEKNMALVIYAGIGEDDVRLSKNEAKIPMTASPIEYQCVDLTFVHKNYAACLAVLKKLYAESLKNPKRLKEIEKAINFTYIVINKSKASITKAELDAYYTKVISDVVRNNMEATIKDTLDIPTKKAIKEVFVDFYVNPGDKTYDKMLKMVGAFGQQTTAPPTIMGSSVISFTDARDALLVTLDMLNSYNDLQWTNDLSELVNSEEEIESEELNLARKALISNKKTHKKLEKIEKPVIALADYKKEYDSALSIRKGELLVIISNEDQGWVMCRNERNKTGWVPLSYLGKRPEIETVKETEDRKVVVKTDDKKETKRDTKKETRDDRKETRDDRKERDTYETSAYSNTKNKVMDIINTIAKRKYVYNQRAYLNGKHYNMDCYFTVQAVLEYAGLSFPNDLHKYKGNGVSKLFYSLRDKGKIVNTKMPKTGDIVFWDNTWDRNKDGYNGNDPLTHTGIVLKVDSDGTVYYLHANYVYGLVIEKLNLYSPDKRHDNNGKEINSFMRAKSKYIPYLSGDLCRASFGRMF